jgi:hypothetical protein
MEETDSITPSDRQSGRKPNKKSTQQETDATMANEVDPTVPAAAPPPESAERTSKSGSCSRKSRQQKKERSQEAKPASVKDEAETSGISSGDESTSDDDQASETTALAPKNHAGVNGTSKNKERTNGTVSKKKTSKASTKKQKKPKKKKNKTGSFSDTASDSDTDSASSDSESSDNEDPDTGKKRTKSSSGLKGQLRALELQFAQLQHQLGNSNGLPPPVNPSAFAQPPNPNPSAFASFGSSTPSYSLQYPSNALASQAAGLDPTLFARRRSIAARPNRGRRRPGLLSRVPDLQISDPDNITNDYLPGELRVKGKKPKSPAFKRVDQVWDNSIHNFKLQDTADTDTDSQYDEYIFHVRRKFDWEGKHTATIVDIKSKLLRECLQDVIGNAEGISLVDETPKMNPEILFL